MPIDTDKKINHLNSCRCQKKTFTLPLVNNGVYYNVQYLFFHMEDKKLIFNELPNIESVCAVLGLVFPDSATEFQKAALTLAHLMASLRDFVLKGHDIPLDLVELADRLSIIMVDNEYKQR